MPTNTFTEFLSGRPARDTALFVPIEYGRPTGLFWHATGINQHFADVRSSEDWWWNSASNDFGVHKWINHWLFIRQKYGTSSRQPQMGQTDMAGNRTCYAIDSWVRNRPLLHMSHIIQAHETISPTSVNEARQCASTVHRMRHEFEFCLESYREKMEVEQEHWYLANSGSGSVNGMQASLKPPKNQPVMVLSRSSYGSIAGHNSEGSTSDFLPQ